MKVIRSIKQMQRLCQTLKGKKSIALVPTMGSLHEGHLSLVRIAQQKAAVSIVSIFVNPTQFAPSEDYKNYPRHEHDDIKKLESLVVDYCFIPTVQGMYPDGFQTNVKVTRITAPLCGQRRPHHFEGVTTVVLKLFHITQPDHTVFGQKDYQQYLAIKAMIRDLNLPIVLHRGRTIREKDGLAMSSRNAGLTPSERGQATCLYRGLQAVKDRCAKKSLTPTLMRNIFLSEISKHEQVTLEYFECLRADNLEQIKNPLKRNTLLAAAIRIGRVRLIDNIII